MKILVVGGGAREHAIVWKCRQSKLVDRIFCAPGNTGIGQIAKCVDIAADDIEGLVAFANDYEIDLTIVGPEMPLINGIADRFEEEGLLIFGPSKDAACIEGSKVFGKNVLDTCGLSHATAPYRLFSNPKIAREYIREHSMPLVIKANGLASGKGVVVAKSTEEGMRAVDELMAQDSGRLLLIEECLEGWECSFTILTDGRNMMPFPVSRDYKQDLYGNNTGGMGAYSPVATLSQEHHDEILGYIRRVLDFLRDMGRPYKGFLYPGIMITEDGPKFLEFNCRLGDPEAQVLLPRMRADFAELCYFAAKGNLSEISGVSWRGEAVVNVVMASPGYPGEYENGLRIYGTKRAREEGARIFHGGTKRNKQGQLISDGGRVLSVVQTGETLEEARDKAYRAVRRISFGNKNSTKGRQWYRSDIAANTAP